MGILHADRGLAARIERSGVRDMEACAISARDSGVYDDAALFRVGGGIAAWYSPDNVLNGSIGLGMNGRVELEAVVALEAFYRERGARPTVDVCPLADPSLTMWLAERMFVPLSYENVLVRSIGARQGLPDTSGDVELLIGEDVDRAVWADVIARGFTEDEPTAEDHRVARASSMCEDSTLFMALVHGSPAGGGMLALDGGLGHLNADATLPAFRDRGVQHATIVARLRHAAECGADLVYVETAPGSGSQRNMERLGFRVAYTRVTLATPQR
jgi:GNAT superfamily N-acetyltransferase